MHDNVAAYRDDSSREDVVEALRAAHVLDEVMALPDGPTPSSGRAAVGSR